MPAVIRLLLAGVARPVHLREVPAHPVAFRNSIPSRQPVVVVEALTTPEPALPAVPVEAGLEVPVVAWETRLM